MGGKEGKEMVKQKQKGDVQRKEQEAGKPSRERVGGKERKEQESSRRKNKTKMF